MGRLPCCDKTVKKGPWTPEEDILLASYIQEHGPGKWNAVPANTGLLRCSKSCRLRWTNYLRPGIKRGNFTDQEEKLIIHLQALLGNRWTAIAAYLPQRTDNDIKNYWNTRLKKKLSKLHNNINGDQEAIFSKGQWAKALQTDIHMAKRALSEALSVGLKPSRSAQCSCTKPVPFSPAYASSTENISRLLQGWTKNIYNSSKSVANNGDESKSDSALDQMALQSLETWLMFDENAGEAEALSVGLKPSCRSAQCSSTKPVPFSSPTYASSTENISRLLQGWTKNINSSKSVAINGDESKSDSAPQMPLQSLETWLFDENAGKAMNDDILGKLL